MTSCTNHKITMRTITDYFCLKYLEFQEQMGVENPVPYSFVGQKDGPVIARLRNLYGDENMFKLIDRFFASSDPWLDGKCRKIGIMSHKANELMSE